MELIITFILVWGAFGALVFFSFVWPFIALRRSPKYDVTYIRARLDGEGHRLLEVVRDGSDWAFQNRHVVAWRKYRVVTEYPDGSRRVRELGVHCTLFSQPDLVLYKEGLRTGLWTQAQASLP